MVDKGDGDGPLEDLTVHGIPLTIASTVAYFLLGSFFLPEPTATNL